MIISLSDTNRRSPFPGSGWIVRYGSLWLLNVRWTQGILLPWNGWSLWEYRAGRKCSSPLRPSGFLNWTSIPRVPPLEIRQYSPVFCRRMSFRLLARYRWSVSGSHTRSPADRMPALLHAPRVRLSSNILILFYSSSLVRLVCNMAVRVRSSFMRDSTNSTVSWVSKCLRT